MRSVVTKGSDLLVAALENEGVERIFGIPGEENLDVVESLRTSPIELVITRHEQAAGFMAAMLYPKRRELAVCGDGGFMMNSQELETAVRLKLDLVVLVLVDSAFGMIRWKQAVDGFADFGMTFGNPDFALYAQAYGAEGHRLTEIGDFVPTLEAAFDAGGVHLVAVPIDYSENKRVLVDELRDRQKSVTGR